MIKKEYYLSKIKKAMDYSDNYKKNKYLKKIIEGGGIIYTGSYKDGVFEGTLNKNPDKIYRYGNWSNNKDVELHYLDESFAHIYNNLKNKIKGEIVIVSRSLDDKIWILGEKSDIKTVQYYKVHISSLVI